MKTLSILLVTSSMTATTAAHADDAIYSLSIGSHTRWFGDTSAASLGGDSLAGPRIVLGRSLSPQPRRRFTVGYGVFVRYDYGTASGTMFGTLTSELSQHAWSAGARIETPLVLGVRGYGEAALGVTRSALAVRTSNREMPVDDHGWEPLASATVGLDAPLIRQRGFRLGVALDVGYTWVKAVPLRALPSDRPDPQLAIPTDFTALGSLDTRGPALAVGLRGAY